MTDTTTPPADLTQPGSAMDPSHPPTIDLHPPADASAPTTSTTILPQGNLPAVDAAHESVSTTEQVDTYEARLAAQRLEYEETIRQLTSKHEADLEALTELHAKALRAVEADHHETKTELRAVLDSAEAATFGKGRPDAHATPDPDAAPVPDTLENAGDEARPRIVEDEIGANGGAPPLAAETTPELVPEVPRARGESRRG